MLSQSKFIHFGTSVKILDEKSLDIGLIEIDHSVKDLLSNTENVDQNVCIYSGPFESIFDKEIFKYKPSDKLYEVCKCGTPNYGTIVSESEHEECKPENGQFLVKSENGVFAVKGESGTAVAAKRKEDNVIELVGIICGGSGDNTVCLFIPDVFHFYKNRYDMILELYDACILCGVKIYFNLSTPEQISPPSYDLVDHALNLMCYKFENVDVKIYERLIERERDLSLRVTQRLCLNDNAIFENDNPNYVAIESGMLACDFLYVGNARAAENRLKKAIFCFLKSDDFGLRLLCNLITYITWYCLVKNNDTSLDKLKKLLENGKKSFECDFRTLRGFPLESLGFLYYDYSRYYMAMWDKMRERGHDHRNNTTERSYRFEAVEKAKQSVKIFKEDHNEKKSTETLRRLVLAKCQQVYVLLGCGHDFITCEEVSNEQITEAENIIKGMEEVTMKEIPLVQNVDYLIALCDLQYRNGHTSKVLKTAC